MPRFISRAWPTHPAGAVRARDSDANLETALDQSERTFVVEADEEVLFAGGPCGALSPTWASSNGPLGGAPARPVESPIV